MISIDEMKNFVFFVANKSQQGVNPTVDNFNLAADRAVWDETEEAYKKWQLDQNSTDELSYLLKKVSLQVDKGGKASYPSDYLHTSSIRYNWKVKDKSCGEYITKPQEVDQLNDAELGNRLASSIVYPSKRYPAMSYGSDYMQFYPIDLGYVDFTYLREPAKPEWVFTVVNGRPVYDSANSVNIEAPKEIFTKIAMRILSYLGVNIREPQLIQYAEMQEQKQNR